MMKKLIWRLKEQPTSESLQELVSSQILTKDEAREILFSSETEEDRDKKSLESEIKFLRDLVEKLSQGNNGRIVEIIREVEKPYRVYPWYPCYQSWCTVTTDCSTGAGIYTATNATSNFSNISIF